MLKDRLIPNSKRDFKGYDVIIIIIIIIMGMFSVA